MLIKIFEFTFQFLFVFMEKSYYEAFLVKKRSEKISYIVWFTSFAMDYFLTPHIVINEYKIVFHIIRSLIVLGVLYYGTWEKGVSLGLYLVINLGVEYAAYICFFVPGLPWEGEDIYIVASFLVKLTMALLIVLWRFVNRNRPNVTLPTSHWIEMITISTISVIVCMSAFIFLGVEISVIASSVIAVFNVLIYMMHMNVLKMADKNEKSISNVINRDEIIKEKNQTILERDEVIKSLKAQESNDRIFEYGPKTNRRKTNVNDIVSVSGKNGWVTFIMRDGSEDTFRSSLDRIFEKLNTDIIIFIRPNQNELINFAYITSRSTDDFFINNKSFKITKTYKKSVNEQYEKLIN